MNLDIRGGGVSKSRVLVTGASGFVGSALTEKLLANESFIPVCAVRDLDFGGCAERVVYELDKGLPIEALKGIDTIVHAAARVHVMKSSSSDDLSAFRKANVEGTLKLARGAAEAGVRRFIFISSVKVNGEQTFPGRPYLATDTPAPIDPYGISKAEAESALRTLAADTGLEVVIIRPPLVYGPGVKANFQKMLGWVHSRLPLPFGSISNQRSLVALENLLDLIVHCIRHPGAPGNTFLVSDGEDLSTTQLLQRVARALGVHSALIPVPERLLIVCLILLGKRALATRLCGSLQVDISNTRELLGWAPPVSSEQALDSVAKDFLEAKKK
ncbi:UDP-glucose 4-epimerase family protein [Pseudomonas vancouverensis]|uniref:UDP-glucose 4-epimerase family protein n=1 Tax=Pseudomonas vancouverensis TaxID=95300 RepID=UPI003CFF15D5